MFKFKKQARLRHELNAANSRTEDSVPHDCTCTHTSSETSGSQKRKSPAVTCASRVLASFQNKIKEAIAMVRFMSTEDKLKAVQYWNVVSENLQDVVNSSADDISALHSRLCERENMILLQKPGVNTSRSASGHPPQGTEASNVIRRVGQNSADGVDRSRKHNGAAGAEAGVMDPYLDSQPAAASVAGTQLATPALAGDYTSLSACEALDDPLEPAVSPGLRSDPLLAEEALESEGNESTSRDTSPPSVLCNVSNAGAHDNVEKASDDAASASPHVSEGQNSVGFNPEMNCQLSKNADFQKYLSFAKNETGSVVLNFFTRHPKSSDAKVSGKYFYLCNVCQTMFQSLPAFFFHFAIYCEQLVCCKCGRRCHSKTVLRAHLLSHSKALLKCIECERAFTTFSNLSRHMRTHTGERRHECSVCHKRFAEGKDLRTHSRLHSGERPYECAQCSARFVQPGALKAHLRHHSGEKPHLCDLCGKAFGQMSSLKDHKLRHEGEKRFPCGRCSKAFNVRSDLKRHHRSHLGEKPHKCSRCSKSFIRPEALAQHMNWHLGKRPYQCSICSRSYANRSACTKHMKTHTQDGFRPPSPGSSASDPDSPPPAPTDADSGT